MNIVIWAAFILLTLLFLYVVYCGLVGRRPLAYWERDEPEQVAAPTANRRVSTNSLQILASELLRQRVDGIRTNRKLTCIGMKFTPSNAIGGVKALHSLAIALPQLSQQCYILIEVSDRVMKINASE